jgi:hypothetical protein
MMMIRFCVQGGQTHHSNLRDLDVGEGNALHVHLFEETLDWYEPLRECLLLVVFENSSDVCL